MRKIRLKKPTKDYEAAGFNKYLIKKDAVWDQTNKENVSRYGFATQDGNALNQIDNRSLRIHKIGTVVLDTVEFDGINGIYRGDATVDHGLGYIPTFMGFYKGDSDTSYSLIPDFQFFFAFGYNGFLAFNAHATETQVVFSVFTSPGLVLPVVPDTPYTIKYYIFRESIDE